MGLPEQEILHAVVPGDPDPAGRPIPWDSSVCHHFFWDSAGLTDVGTGTFYAWSTLPNKVPPPLGPVPTEPSYLPLPTLAFCPVPRSVRDNSRHAVPPVCRHARTR
jgi:hypothetical protein